MRLVVFDAMELRFQLLRVGIKRAGERFWDSSELHENFGAVAGKRRHFEGIQKFGRNASVRIARDRDVIDVGERDASRLQAVANRQRWKSSGILHAVEAFFFDRSDQLAVANDRGGSIPVVCVDAKDIHSVKAVYTRLSRRRLSRNPGSSTTTSRKIRTAPLIQNVKRPRPRPRRLARNKI